MECLMAEAEFFVQVTPIFTDGTRTTISSLKTSTITEKNPAPSQRKAGAIVLHMKLELPETIFFPIMVHGTLPVDFGGQITAFIAELEDDNKGT